jgi:hypothetical protein
MRNPQPQPPESLVLKGVDVAPHMMTLPGGLYLKVPGRYLLFRQDHPLGRVETSPHLIDLERGIAIFIAKVYTAEGQLLATATGSETMRGFPAGWIEKAETVAEGRALAKAGYGTQFATADFHGQEALERDATNDHGKLADAPVSAKKGRGAGAPVSPDEERRLAIASLNDVKKRLNLSRTEVERVAGEQFGLPIPDLTASQIRALVATFEVNGGGEDSDSERHAAQQGASGEVA